MMIERFGECLDRQLDRHPVMEAQDIVKLCYQAAFGAEHLLEDREGALRFFREEYLALDPSEGDLYEQATFGVFRVNMAVWKKRGLPPEWLFRLFAGADRTFAENSGAVSAGERESLFRAYLNLAEERIGRGCVVSLPEWQAYRRSYEEGPVRPVHHSDRYRKAEQPAYRIVSGIPDLGRVCTVLESLAAAENAAGTELSAHLGSFSAEKFAGAERSAHLGSQDPENAAGLECSAFQGSQAAENAAGTECSPRLESLAAGNSAHQGSFAAVAGSGALPSGRTVHVAAVDGRCASGKTTLASVLGTALDAGVIHMDDFFLPGSLRTRERLAEPGGNVHYERFREEVLPYVRQKEAFAYRRFDCGRMEIGSDVRVKASCWRIVEGAYSTHPLLGEYMDFRIFSDVGVREQLRRICARDGEESLRMFRERWIPMEEKYFSAFSVREKADLVLAGD